MEFDFKKIREHEGTRSGGFEEMICQLAYYEYHQKQSVRFIRKDGAGGDAGVECYWVMADGNEYCWQAKYFINEFGRRQLQQLEKSFVRAIEKHPRMSKYFVCIPRDIFDGRVKDKNSNTGIRKSNWDKFLDYCLKASSGREIEIVLWSKHHIQNKLMLDLPSMHGKAEFWFDVPLLNTNKIKKVTKDSIQSLSRRYLPQYHVDSAIFEYFDALSCNSNWIQKIENAIHLIISLLDRILSKLNDLKERNTGNSSEALLKHLCNTLFDVGELLRVSRAQDRDIHKNASEVLTDVSRCFRSIRDLEAEYFSEESKRILLSLLHHVETNLRELVQDDKLLVSQAGVMLLVGDAGMGKSHTFGEYSRRALDSNSPVVLVLGQQYRGGSIIDVFRELLDLRNFSDKTILGVLNSFGETNGQRIVLAVDAINEGECFKGWQENLYSFFSTLKQYPNIALVLSCRSTYLDYVIPEVLTEEKLPRVMHTGFQNIQEIAFNKLLPQHYSPNYSIPFLPVEYTNPLFLTTICLARPESFARQSLRDSNSLFNLVDNYIELFERKIALQKQVNVEENTLRIVLATFASHMFPNAVHGLPINVARNLVNDLDPNPSIGPPLYSILVDEGVLLQDWVEPDCFGVKFTFEKIQDVFIATSLLRPQGNLLPKAELTKILKILLGSVALNSSTRGVVEAAFVVVPEWYQIELRNTLEEEYANNRALCDDLFIQSLRYRSINSVTETTVELFEESMKSGLTASHFDSMIALGTNPKHLLNSEFIHDVLGRMSMADRDGSWNKFLINSCATSGDYESSNPGRLVKWGKSVEVSSIDDHVLLHSLVVLTWFLSSSNRLLRDQSTKVMVRLLVSKPQKLVILLNKFTTNNDPYLVERLLAVVYGVSCYLQNPTVSKEIGLLTKRILEHSISNYPHLLLFDYAQNTIDVIRHFTSLPLKKEHWVRNNGIQRIEPPRDFSNREFEKLLEDKSSDHIIRSIAGFPGDFGKYTLGCVKYWSATVIGRKKAESGYEVRKRFAKEHLSGELQKQYLDHIEEAKCAIKRTLDIPLAPETIFEVLTSDTDTVEEIIENNNKSIQTRIEDQLSEDEIEQFTWIRRTRMNSFAEFSRRRAQRWIVKRAYDIGWNDAHFRDLDNHISRIRLDGRRFLERVGKKYQWIALHEFLARVAANYHYLGAARVHENETEEFVGPHQIWMRDIDPTCIEHVNKDEGNRDLEHAWWQPFEFPWPTQPEYLLQKQVVDCEQVVPPYERLVKVRQPGQDINWIVLHGESYQRESGSALYYLDCWYRMHSIIVKSSDVSKLLSAVEGKSLANPNLFSFHNTLNLQGYFGEYPWHPMFDAFRQKGGLDSYEVGDIDIEQLVPYSEYTWEAGQPDFSISQSVTINLPSLDLIEEIGMERRNNKGEWFVDDTLAFIDPSVKENGPPHALVNEALLNSWLEENKLSLVWFFGGEKSLVESGIHNLKQRTTFSAFCYLQNGSFVVKEWFDKI